MRTILVLEPQKPSATALVQLFNEDSVLCAANADEAIEIASNNDIDVVILELSLSGHSGFEFIYEFRSYPDWIHIPIIVYTTIPLAEEVLSSKGWSALDIAAYIYKPTGSLAKVKDSVQKALSS